VRREGGWEDRTGQDRIRIGIGEQDWNHLYWGLAPIPTSYAASALHGLYISLTSAIPMGSGRVV